MDGFPFELPIFLVATFAGALVAGLSGFAFGLVVSSIWVYILSPLQKHTVTIEICLIVLLVFGPSLLKYYFSDHICNN
jgi:hypothetical protein